jgi:hypothetical protein
MDDLDTLDTTTRDGASRTRARWLGVLLILVALGAISFEAWQLREEAPPAAAVRLEGFGRPSLAEMLGQSSVAPALLADRAGPAASGSASVAPLGPGEIEVCGIGRLRPDAESEADGVARLEAPARKAREQLLAAMGRSGDDTERAAALFIKGTMVQQVWSAAASGVPATTAPRDKDAVDDLARLAVSTRSPEVYAWALQACDRRGHDGPCQMLSTEQWTRLDAGNAAPWLRMAEEAARRQDTAGVADAMYRAAQSSSFDTRTLGVVKRAMAQLPADGPPFSRFVVATELQGMNAVQAPMHAAVMGHCGKNAMLDSNRLQACSAVAELLVQKGQSLVDRMMGVTLASRAGWPAERLQLLRDEMDAAFQVGLQLEPAEGRMYACDAVERQMRHYGAVAATGEWAALQGLVKRSPEGVAKLAAQRRVAAAKAALASASGPASPGP